MQKYYLSFAELVLPGKGHKYDEVFEELIDADFEKQRISRLQTLNESAGVQIKLFLIVFVNLIKCQKVLTLEKTKIFLR